MQERLAKLSGGVAVPYVGAASEVEMKEKKDRVDDAIVVVEAVQARFDVGYILLCPQQRETLAYD